MNKRYSVCLISQSSWGWKVFRRWTCTKRMMYSRHVQHMAQHGSVSLWQWLCSTEQPGLGMHPSLTEITHQCEININWAKNRAQGRRSVVLTQVMANYCMHFDTLAKHRHLNSEKYTVMLFTLIKEFEKRFQVRWKKLSVFWCICNSISVCINTLLADIQKECIEWQYIHLWETILKDQVQEE